MSYSTAVGKKGIVKYNYFDWYNGDYLFNQTQAVKACEFSILGYCMFFSKYKYTSSLFF